MKLKMNQKRKIVFIAYISNYGGIESLIIRLTKWMTEHNNSVDIIGDKDRSLDNRLVYELRQSGANIKLLSFRKQNSHKKIEEIKSKYKQENVLCIVFSYPGLYLANQLFANLSSASIMFYDPHQFGLMMDFKVHNHFLKILLKIISKNITRKMYRAHKVIFMDPLCKKRTLREFKIVSKYNDVILLPMNVKKFDDNLSSIVTKVNIDSFNIVTICRIEFPFKGYIIGLLKMFEDFVNSGHDFYLTIIGTGSSDLILEAKLENLSDSVKSRVVWIKGLPYEELDEQLKKADLYIGMGTTVLDAVNSGVPALPIGSYTYKCKGYGAFFNEPENLGGMYGKTRIEPLIEQVAQMSGEEYIALCKKNHEALVYNYDIDVIGERFLNFENYNCKSVFNIIEKCLFGLGKRFFS